MISMLGRPVALDLSYTVDHLESFPNECWCMGPTLNQLLPLGPSGPGLGLFSKYLADCKEQLGLDPFSCDDRACSLKSCGLVTVPGDLSFSSTKSS